MRQVLVLLALTVIAAAAAPAQEAAAEDQAGSICVAPVKDDGDPRSYYSEQFGVRVDNGRWLSVPSEAPALNPGIALKDKHLVSIRDGSKTIESFWFRFDKFESRDLCLWYKPWYRTWSLWAAAYGGQKCRCSTAEDERAG
jgi:hypothetical protein